jgi:hypothetical protein
MTWADTCSRCGNDRLWWRSRSGYLVCLVCARDPLEAQGSGACNDTLPEERRALLLTGLG